ncbi:hypothetical protein OG204_07055 [Streptomyces sp. NBC_01387]|uniref:hypothetical protein n=1 Tax=unclassified Streptomyces TaxID=2593676 RepID=UPI00202511BF|nr:MULTISPECIES: hypothetical protein [unclassified Streptomyces]MCX4551953.1 hypothetical protein [Streptomyces sp. NBC_01500]WSC24808.1 hypothetical protein OIE60_28565 [Streptomyces sp. NBC_01766]WSV58788.1 hypothetical protein OG282_27990 [Streptomyces sp. NBC_01014]
MSLPGADELFRTTGGMALQSSSPRRPVNGEPRVPGPAGESDSAASAAERTEPAAAEHATAVAEPAEPRSRTAEAEAATSRRPQEVRPMSAPVAPAAQQRRRGGGRGANRRPTGRERHDEKITVYVSAEELMDLEHARLVLRGEHGLAVDRGRIVREAVAVVLADLESRGDASILVRRLRGR